MKRKTIEDIKIILACNNFTFAMGTYNKILRSECFLFDIFVLKQLISFRTYYVFLAVAILCLCATQSTAMSEKNRKRYLKLSCSIQCSPGTKVCAQEAITYDLVEFEDMCLMFKLNCEKHTYFFKVDKRICEQRNAYKDDNVFNKFNDSLKFVHVKMPFLHPDLIKLIPKEARDLRLAEYNKTTRYPAVIKRTRVFIS